MKLADRMNVTDKGQSPQVYIGRRHFRSTNGTMKETTTWYAEFYMNGKQRRLPLDAGTKNAAIREGQTLAEKLANEGEGAMAQRLHIRVSELVDRYLAYQELEDRAPLTLVKYRHDLGVKFKGWWKRQGDRPAATFRPDDYLRFRKYLIEDAKLALKTISSVLMVVRQMFKWAAQKSDPILIPRYPLTNVKLMKVPHSPQPCFTPEQVRAILDNADPLLRPVYATFAFTGMRFGEIRDLEWRDIELRDDGGTIFVSRGGSRKDMTKSGQGRPIPITKELRDVLAALPRDQDRVFSHPPTTMYGYGERALDETQLLHAIKRLCKRLGFSEKLKLHSFRHFFASTCARNNVSYKFALKWMGHSSSEILDLYFHMHDREAQQAINGLVFMPPSRIAEPEEPMNRAG